MPIPLFPPRKEPEKEPEKKYTVVPGDIHSRMNPSETSEKGYSHPGHPIFGGRKSSSPKYRRAHYEEMAELLGTHAKERAAGATTHQDSFLDKLTGDIEDMFARDNPRFQRERFRSAIEKHRNA